MTAGAEMPLAEAVTDAKVAAAEAVAEKTAIEIVGAPSAATEAPLEPESDLSFRVPRSTPTQSPHKVVVDLASSSSSEEELVQKMVEEPRKRKRASLDLLEIDVDEEVNKRLKAAEEAMNQGASAEAVTSSLAEDLAPTANDVPASAEPVRETALEVPAAAGSIQRGPEEGEKEGEGGQRDESSPPHQADVHPSAAQSPSSHWDFEGPEKAKTGAEEEIQNEPSSQFHETDQFIVDPALDGVHMKELQSAEATTAVGGEAQKEISVSPAGKSFHSFRSSEMGFEPTTIIPDRIRDSYADAEDDAVHPFISLLDIPESQRARVWAQQTAALEGVPPAAVENPHLKSLRLMMAVSFLQLLLLFLT